MKYVKQRELREVEEKEKSDPFYFLFHFYHPYTCRRSNLCSLTPLRPPPSPPLFSRFLVKEVVTADTLQLIRFHIQRLEDQPTFNARASLNSANNYLENFNEQKRDNFIKTGKKKNKRELNNKFNKFNMKVERKNFKNKFSHKYG